MNWLIKYLQQLCEIGRESVPKYILENWTKSLWEMIWFAHGYTTSER